MKLADIPKSKISPVSRILVLHRDEDLIMIKVPDSVDNAEAETLVKFADDSARIAMIHSSEGFDYIKHVEEALDAMRMGFEIFNIN